MISFGNLDLNSQPVTGSSGIGRTSMTMAIVVVLSIIATVVHFHSAPTQAHDWYPKECCQDNDCAPVESAQLVPAGNGLLQLVVTSKHGTAVVPQNIPRRLSKDSRMHVCLLPDPWGGMDVMCLFVPPPV